MRIHFIQAFLVIVIMATLSFVQQEQTTKPPAHAVPKPQTEHIEVTPELLQWRARGDGIEAAVLSGSPDVEGAPFVLRLKLADGIKVPPHWHPIDEHLTVITGMFYMGMGEKFNESQAKEMPAGSYALMPKEMRHFAWTKGQTIVQIHGIGPFKTYWVKEVEERAKN
jgi:anti-sigma factor ChrR (cupin superfamily)